MLGYVTKRIDIGLNTIIYLATQKKQPLLLYLWNLPLTEFVRQKSMSMNKNGTLISALDFGFQNETDNSVFLFNFQFLYCFFLDNKNYENQNYNLTCLQWWFKFKTINIELFLISLPIPSTFKAVLCMRSHLHNPDVF